MRFPIAPNERGLDAGVACAVRNPNSPLTVSGPAVEQLRYTLSSRAGSSRKDLENPARTN